MQDCSIIILYSKIALRRKKSWLKIIVQDTKTKQITRITAKTILRTILRTMPRTSPRIVPRTILRMVMKMLLRMHLTVLRTCLEIQQKTIQQITTNSRSIYG